MRAPRIPIRWDEGVDLLILDDGEEWCAVTEAFNRYYPDRAGLPFDPANYSQAEIDAVMVEFEPKKKPASASPASASPASASPASASPTSVPPLNSD